ncbi:MAG: RNase adapter RapZ [Pseudomonadota bacterium]
MNLLVVSGMSGSGKSVALHVLEDQGYYCIDNLPLGLLPALTAELGDSDTAPEHVAVGIDARNLTRDLARYPSMVEQMRAHGIHCQTLYLFADRETLLKRYSETRRKHPLTDGDHGLADAIEAERALLEPIARDADLPIDTSHTNVHQLRDLIAERVGRSTSGLSLQFLSFGFKHGVPADADFVFDLRCLPNPHWQPELRARTGRDPEVAEYLDTQPLATEMLGDIRAFLEAWLPHFQRDNRSYMTVAIGCTGGQHRSVHFVERLGAIFGEQLEHVQIRHRELS